MSALAMEITRKIELLPEEEQRSLAAELMYKFFGEEEMLPDEEEAFERSEREWERGEYKFMAFEDFYK